MQRRFGGAVKVAILILLASCWTASSSATMRIVYHNKYVHDVPRDCAGLPAFPSIILLEDPSYVALLDAWIDRAGQCLYAKTYKIETLLETVKW
jgi:hypothetical protein